MRASRLLRAISRLRNVLEGSIKSEIEGLDVNFHISNEVLYTLDVKLGYVILKLQYAANCTGSKLSQCSAILFLMRLSYSSTSALEKSSRTLCYRCRILI